MFGISGFEIIILGVLALLVFGPERLPGVAQEAARMIRQLRKMAEEAREEVTGAFPELDDLGIRDLDPRQFVRRQLLDEKNDLDAALEGKPAKPVRTPADTEVAPPLEPASEAPAAEMATPPVWDADAT